MQLPSLEVSEYWSHLWSYEKEALKLTRNNHDPLEDVDCPHEIESHVVALAISAIRGKSYWRFGGFMNQKLKVGFSGIRTFDSDAVSKQRLYLNRWQLFVFPKLTEKYTLSFEFPFWFEGVILDLMVYGGPHYDPLESDVGYLKGSTDYNRALIEQVQLNTEDLLNR